METWATGAMVPARLDMDSAARVPMGDLTELDLMAALMALAATPDISMAQEAVTDSTAALRLET